MLPGRELLSALCGNETDGFPYSPNELRKINKGTLLIEGNRGSSWIWRKSLFC